MNEQVDRGMFTRIATRRTPWISRQELSGGRAVVFATLAYSVILGGSIIAAGLAVLLLTDDSSPRAVTFVAFLGILLGEVFMLRLLRSALQTSGESLADLGWKRTQGWVLGVGVLIGLAIGISTTSYPLLARHMDELSLFRFWGGLIAVFVAVVEEFVFRGFVMTRLAQAGYSVRVQILLSALAFAIAHGPGAPYTFVTGAALASLYVLGKRSLFPVIIAHAIYNFFIEPWFILEVIRAGLRILGLA